MDGQARIVEVPGLASQQNENPRRIPALHNVPDTTCSYTTLTHSTAVGQLKGCWRASRWRPSLPRDLRIVWLKYTKLRKEHQNAKDTTSKLVSQKSALVDGGVCFVIEVGDDMRRMRCDLIFVVKE